MPCVEPMWAPLATPPRNAGVGSPQSDRVRVGGKLQRRNGIQDFRSCCRGYAAGAIENTRYCGRRNPCQTGNIPDRAEPVLRSIRRVGHRFLAILHSGDRFPIPAPFVARRHFVLCTPLFGIVNRPAIAVPILLFPETVSLKCVFPQERGTFRRTAKGTWIVEPL